MERIPFDINLRPEIEGGKYLVETRNGKPVKIRQWDRGDDTFPILAYVEIGAEQHLYGFTEKGKYDTEGTSVLDLFLVPAADYKEPTAEQKDKCLGCNNVKGCVTCVDGNQWAHISEVEDEGELGRGPHTESWLESVKKELQHEEELLDMRLDTLRRIREKKNLFQQCRPEEDFETEYAKFSNDPNALDYAFPIDLADYKDFARHFYELGLNAREEKPCEDLEKEAKEFAEREYECDSLDRDALEKGFYWGAKWQKEQMMEGAVDATVVETTQIIPGCGSYTGEFKNKEIHLKVSEEFKKGEKVKALIVKKS